jgi:hypothetical protein
VKVLSLSTENGKKEGFVRLTSCSTGAVSLENIETIGGKGNRQIRNLGALVSGLKHPKHVLKMKNIALNLFFNSC